MKPFIYIRSLRYAEHTVFSVADGQKFYYDPIHGTKSAYSSGQQVKRSVLDAMTTHLNVPFAPITFNWTIKDNAAQQGEAWSLCDPSYPDQLIGGYMKAEKDKGTVKRRSPLSISAMRPLHPFLGGLEDGKGEAMSFDRSSSADRQKVNVFKETSEGKREHMTDAELNAWLQSTNRSLPPKKWIEPQKRASGLFVYDIAIDLRTLFCVSTNQFEPEINPAMIENLKNLGWKLGENVFGNCLICPEQQRTKIIIALADSVLNWRITSNQSRTFSLQETLAVSISDNANQVAYAIRAGLDPEKERTAIPIIDETSTAKIFLTPSVAGFFPGMSGRPSALDEAAQYLTDQMLSFPYESQLGENGFYSI